MVNTNCDTALSHFHALALAWPDLGYKRGFCFTSIRKRATVLALQRILLKSIKCPVVQSANARPPRRDTLYQYRTLASVLASAQCKYPQERPELKQTPQ